MSTTTESPVETATASLQEQARRHLWMHFTRMGAYQDHEIPIIVKGDGCYVWDEHGKRYLDGLSALFCVNIGHGRADVAQAGADQAKELGFFTNWSYAHPRAIELATRVAYLAPGDLNRVFFTSGGGEAVESALKLARQYYKLTGKPTSTRSSPARSPITEPPSARCRRPGSRASGSRSSRSRPAAATSRTPTCTGSRPAISEFDLSRDRRADRVRGPRHGRGRDPRAGAERGRLLLRLPRATSSGSARSATSTTSSSSPTR